MSLDEELLATLLSDREGWWYCADAIPDPAWCFGLGSECLVAISVSPQGYSIYVHADDRDLTVGGIEDVREWLAANEPPLELSPLARSLMDDLLPRMTDQWKREGETPD